MERKIGEIFEYNGEWYQCVEGNGCADCAFYEKPCNRNPLDETTGSCRYYRKDATSVIFKKLEKVGEPFERNGYMYQEYKAHTYPLLMSGGAKIPTYNGFAVIIKQNKEDMEENKTPLPKEDNPLTGVVYAYVNGKISDNELIKSIKEMSDEYPYNKNNIKPFSLEAAKAGKPVCTRDGRKARIICFDRDWDMHIVALVADPIGETVHYYLSNGKVDSDRQLDDDLMMLPEKKEGWVNIYNRYGADLTSDGHFFFTKEEALSNIENDGTYVKTIKMSWEE